MTPPPPPPPIGQSLPAGLDEGSMFRSLFAAYPDGLIVADAQGRIAARNMVGGEEEAYTPGAHYMATRLYDLDCAAIGESSRTEGGAEEVVEFPQRTGKISYKKLVFRDGRLVVVILEMYVSCMAHPSSVTRRWHRLGGTPAAKSIPPVASSGDLGGHRGAGYARRICYYLSSDRIAQRWESGTRFHCMLDGVGNGDRRRGRSSSGA